MSIKFKIPTEEPPKWAADQASALRQFLNTSSGQLFLQQMFYLRPMVSAIPAGAAPLDPVKRSAQSDTQAGYEAAMQQMFELTVSPT